MRILESMMRFKVIFPVLELNLVWIILIVGIILAAVLKPERAPKDDTSPFLGCHSGMT